VTYASRMRRLLVVAVLMVGLIGCKKSGPTILHDDDNPPAAKCASDGDCEVIALSDCCGCCADTNIVAVAKSGPKYERVCGGGLCKSCGGDTKPGSCKQPLPSEFTAICRAGTCARDPKKK
jgi:hypothetical protein